MSTFLCLLYHNDHDDNGNGMSLMEMALKQIPFLHTLKASPYFVLVYVFEIITV